MAWTALTFVECSVLTAAKMAQLQGNFAALAAGEAGAPRLHIDGVSSLALLHASSGILAPVSSVGLLQASSGLLAPQVSSLGTVHAASGLVSPQVSSLGTVHAASGFVSPQVSSLGRVEASSGLSLFGGMRFPHFMLRYTPGNPPTVNRHVNVASLQRVSAGRYVVQLATAFTNSNYFVGGLGANRPGLSMVAPYFNPDSATLSRVAFDNMTNASAAVDSSAGPCTLWGWGD